MMTKQVQETVEQLRSYRVRIEALMREAVDNITAQANAPVPGPAPDVARPLCKMLNLAEGREA